MMSVNKEQVVFIIHTFAGIFIRRNEIADFVSAVTRKTLIVKFKETGCQCIISACIDRMSDSSCSKQATGLLLGEQARIMIVFMKLLEAFVFTETSDDISLKFDRRKHSTAYFKLIVLITVSSMGGEIGRNQFLVDSKAVGIHNHAVAKVLYIRNSVSDTFAKRFIHCSNECKRCADDRS